MRFKAVVVLVTGVASLSLLSACGSNPKEETVSVIDENHFEQLASTPEGAGNAASSVEILGDAPATPAAASPHGASVPAEVINLSAPIQDTATASAPATPSATPTSVSSGASFEQKVQTALKNAGYYSGPIDGKIGQKTREAIKSFQSANGLKADGVVGPSTWEKLKKSISKS